MKTTLLILVVLLCTVIASARPEIRKIDSTSEEERKEESGFVRKRRDNMLTGRKTRHSRQAMWYDYQEFQKTQVLEELLSVIRSLKDEISSMKNLARPPISTPPQNYYIPYPIPTYIPIPPYSFGGPNNNLYNVSSFDNRIDVNQICENNKVDNEDGDDGIRPISLIPVNLNNQQKRPQPPVEHGSQQGGISDSIVFPTKAPDFITKAPATEKPLQLTTVKPPGKCDAAIVYCCMYNGDEQKDCFTRYGCQKTYSTGVACTEMAIYSVIQKFKQTYNPDGPLN